MFSRSRAHSVPNLCGLHCYLAEASLSAYSGTVGNLVNGGLSNVSWLLCVALVTAVWCGGREGAWHTRYNPPEAAAVRSRHSLPGFWNAPVGPVYVYIYLR